MRDGRLSLSKIIELLKRYKYHYRKFRTRIGGPLLCLPLFYVAIRSLTTRISARPMYT